MPQFRSCPTVEFLIFEGITVACIQLLVRAEGFYALPCCSYSPLCDWTQCRTARRAKKIEFLIFVQDARSAFSFHTFHTFSYMKTVPWCNIGQSRKKTFAEAKCDRQVFRLVHCLASDLGCKPHCCNRECNSTVTKTCFQMRVIDR